MSVHPTAAQARAASQGLPGRTSPAARNWPLGSPAPGSRTAALPAWRQSPQQPGSWKEPRSARKMPVAAPELPAFGATLPAQLCLAQPDAVHLLLPVDRNGVCHAPQDPPGQHRLTAEDTWDQKATDCALAQRYSRCFSPMSVAL